MGVGMACSAQSKGDTSNSRDIGKVRCKKKNVTLFEVISIRS